MDPTDGTVLLTGATGLVGRVLGPALSAAGFAVVAVGRSAPEGPSSHEYRRCDLADRDACRRIVHEVRPAAIVHLAGGAAGDAAALYRDNVKATLHLLGGAIRLDPQPYVVVFGSAAEYGAHEGPIAETTPLHPLTDYGKAKKAQTQLARRLAGISGLPLTILRPFNVVAAEQPAASPLGNLRRQLLAGEASPRTIRGGRLDVVRDFIPLAAIVDSVLALLRAPAPGATINLCSGVGIELGAILRAMAHRVGVEIEVEPDLALAALPAAPSVIGDPSRMRQLLGLEIAVSAESLAAILVP